VSLSEKQSVHTADSIINQAISENADQQTTAFAESSETSSANRKTEPANSINEQVVAKPETLKPVKENIITTENLQIAASETAEAKADENTEIAIATVTPETSTEQETTTEQNVKQSEVLQIAQASKDWTEEILKKKEDLMQVGMGVGSGLGGASALSFGRNMDFMSEKLATAETTMANVMAPEDFPDKNYMPPVSVGLLFRWKTAHNFSLESGLVYSYLRTSMSRQNSWSDANAELNLHYLGLPLNAVVDLYKGGKWSIYGSGGIMVEKGLWSFYKQEVYQGPATITTTESKSIDGLQWSLNATLGLSYNVSQDVSLFFDPKLSWYLDNDQPFSVRTHMPLLFGIQAGIRTHL
jgi:opacity protein-like surface antigen